MDTLCTQCGFSLHIDDTQVPPYSFTVDCPRCRKNITVTPPPKAEAVLKTEPAQARGGKSTGPRPQTSTAAASGQSPEGVQSFMQMMATMMAAGSPKVAEQIMQKGFAWQRKQVMVCCAEQTQRQAVETILDKTKYEITPAQTSSQAIEIMHDLKVDVIVLDPQFDAARQGGIAVLRHVSSLMPKYRRRIYVVLVSPQVKTLDTYMAFLNCVNLTVNTEDLESLPAILEKSIKDFNELYRPMYEAASLSPF